MATSIEDRVEELQHKLDALAERLARVESAVAPPARAQVPPTIRPVIAPLPPLSPPLVPVWPEEYARPKPVLPPQPVRRTRDIEELLGGRLLALVGGVAVLVGLVFLVILAIDQGWIDERLRVALAFLGSGGLVLAGAWLHERRGQTQAARATAAVGVAGLFLSLTAATSLYGLVPVPLALAGSFAVGALGVVLALSWGSRTIAGLGILGALASPALLSATGSLIALGFLAVALGAASAILTWKRWKWLRIAAFALAMLQVAAWALFEVPGVWSLAAVLGSFGALNVVAALGYEVRDLTVKLHGSTALLVSTNALIVGGIGFAVLADARAAGLWMAGVSLAHLAAGLAALAWRRVPRRVGFLLLGVALPAGNIAFALLLDGPTLAVGWAFSALALAVIARRRSVEGGLVQGTLAGQLTLAISHTLMFDAPPTAFGSAGSVSFAPLVAIVLSAFACARLARDGKGLWRVVADVIALLTLAYTTALALDGTALVLAWVAQALALLPTARRSGDPLAAGGVFGLLGAAAAHVLAFEARPDALVYGVENFPASALALAAIVGGTVAVARAGLRPTYLPSRVLWLGAGIACGYLMSIGIIDVFQPKRDVADYGFGLGVRQQGQAVLSAFWSVAGLALLRIGLHRNDRLVRLSAFGLLTVAVMKVFLFDMSALDSGYRILSFIVLGLLLLAGAYAYQRTRQNGTNERQQWQLSVGQGRRDVPLRSRAPR